MSRTCTSLILCNRTSKAAFLMECASLVLLLSSGVCEMYAEESHPAKPSSMSGMTMPNVAPFFIENETFSSTLTLVNEAQSQARVTLDVFDLSGDRIATVPESLRPYSQHSIRMKDLLYSSGLNEAAGSVHLVSPRGRTDAVLGQVAITHYEAGGNTYLDEEFAMPMEPGSNVLRAVAEGSPKSTVIALSALANRQLHVVVSCVSPARPPVMRAIAIQPLETKLLRPCISPSADSEIRAPSGVDALPSSDADDVKERRVEQVMGISVTTDGKAGDLVAYGFVGRPTERGLDLGSVEFIDPASLRSSGLAFVAVPAGYSSLLNAKYDVHIGLTNFSTRPEKVSIDLAKGDSDHLSRQTVLQLMLPPNSSREVQLESIQGDAEMRNSLIISSDGHPGDVLAKVAARVGDTSRRVEMPGKDIEQRNNSGGHPWSLESGTVSTLFLFNHDRSSQIITVRIGVDRTEWQKAYRVKSMQTLAVNIGDIIRQGTKDDQGKTLPQDAVAGEIGWSAPLAHLAGRLLQSNNQTGMARNFSCGEVIYLCGIEFAGPSYVVLYFADNESLGAATADLCKSDYPDECQTDGNPVTQKVTAGLNRRFWSGNTGIASFVSNNSAISTWRGGTSIGATGAWAELSSSSYGDCSGSAPANNVAIPVTFSKSKPNPLSNGAIAWTYSFKSSSGNLSDLSACKVGETVFYPPSTGDYVWPAPMVQSSPNPSPVYGPATYGFFNDVNSPPNSFKQPYVYAHFQATQTIQWECSNYKSGAYQRFIPDLTIDRTVNQVNGKWTYTIQKDGATNSAPLP
jgi:hypothetical protein